MSVDVSYVEGITYKFGYLLKNISQTFDGLKPPDQHEQPAYHTIWQPEEPSHPRIQFFKKVTDVCQNLNFSRCV